MDLKKVTTVTARLREAIPGISFTSRKTDDEYVVIGIEKSITITAKEMQRLTDVLTQHKLKVTFGRSAANFRMIISS